MQASGRSESKPTGVNMRRKTVFPVFIGTGKIKRDKENVFLIFLQFPIGFHRTMGFCENHFLLELSSRENGMGEIKKGVSEL